MRLALLLALLLTIKIDSSAQSFRQLQLEFPRVRAAYIEKEEVLRSCFKEAGLAYPPRAIFIRIFKKEAILEVWVRNAGGCFQLLKRYAICSTSGELGPKRKRGDSQMPEGFYQINDFNPQSTFYLSLGLNYPNRSDRILKEGRNPGGAIYIHGSCVTIGCVPITDDKIKELYIMAVEARNSGQKSIPVHIFPCPLDSAGMAFLKNHYPANPELLSFWDNLAEGFRLFEERRIPPQPRVDDRGRYLFYR